MRTFKSIVFFEPSDWEKCVRFKASRMRFVIKIALLGVMSVAISVIILVTIAAALSRDFNDLAQREVSELIDADLAHVVGGVNDLVHAEDDAVRELLSSHLEAARRFLTEEGGASLGVDAIRWTAINQLDGKTHDAVIPRMMLGGVWLGQNREPSTPTPIVDRVTGFAGATATIFQRIDPGDDMIRVATSVLDADGRRAIGTYIPARGPAGAPNPVIAAILRGETYRGRAFVVNAWYLTAYEPIRDATGRIIGMLYVGIPQKSAESRIRQAILGTVLGKTGYVWVITGTGVDKGQYVISKGGARDGEYIWDVRDAEGRFVTREIIEAAIALEPGRLGSYRYRWQNPGEALPRWKVSKLAYYQPWDWIIGAGVYEDEVSVYSQVLEIGRARMTGVMIATGLAITILVGLGGLAMARTIARPLHTMTRAAEAISSGDMSQVVDVDSSDEMGTLARTFNIMAERIRSTMLSLRSSEEKYRGIYENAMEGIFRTSLDGHLIDANPALARMLGFDSPSEAVSSITDIGRQAYVHPEEREALLAEIRERGAASGMEVLLSRKDGSLLWGLISARASQASEHGESYLEGFIADISDLKNAEERLIHLLDEKDALIQEVHHRVKNNLQVIVSMLDLQTQDAAATDVQVALRRIRRRIVSMALVHDVLVHSPDLSMIDFRDYAKSLMDALAAQSSEKAPVKITVGIESIKLPLETALPCGLALGEYVSNALIHAFPPGWTGTRLIKVTMRLTDGRYSLSVADSGVGLPPGFDISTATTLGMRLANASISQIHGLVSVERGPGTRILIDFPAQPYKAVRR